VDVISLIGTKLGSYLMKYFQHPISKQKLLTKTLTKDDSYDIVTLAHPLLTVLVGNRAACMKHAAIKVVMYVQLIQEKMGKETRHEMGSGY
jgi:hypothetical protein